MILSKPTYLIKSTLLIGLIILFPLFITSQTSFKGNAITTLVGIPNFGVEFELGKKTTFQLDVAASFWTINGVPYKFGQIFPEFRYYTKQAGLGFYVGAHIGGAKFKLQKWNQTNSYQEGYSVFLGATIGYQFELNERWNLEAFLGGGSQQGHYKGYFLDTGERSDGVRHYNKSGEFLPYRGGLMIVYKLKNHK
ncbi:DUF3575 domain-containing protein [Mariniflexile sp.]|uniref:DUF3575 domain-containing protein n=1 Tax=Mariniflexile sp. TaxID=1979402 RepID=UPI003566A0A2